MEGMGGKGRGREGTGCLVMSQGVGHGDVAGSRRVDLYFYL